MYSSMPYVFHLPFLAHPKPNISMLTTRLSDR